jgi:hypothetical protein
VSISVVLWGGEEISVDNLLGGWTFKAADVLVCTAAFFEVPPVLSVACPFRLHASYIVPSCVVCCPVVFGGLVWPARVLTLSTAFNSCKVTV